MNLEVRYVQWIDSMGAHGWELLEEIKTNRPLLIHTVGFVVDEGEDYVTILQSYDERASGKPQGDHAISIPRSAIQSQRRLDEVPSESKE